MQIIWRDDFEAGPSSREANLAEEKREREMGRSLRFVSRDNQDESIRWFCLNGGLREARTEIRTVASAQCSLERASAAAQWARSGKRALVCGERASPTFIRPNWDCVRRKSRQSTSSNSTQ